MVGIAGPAINKNIMKRMLEKDTRANNKELNG